jgi:hypothetical protein
MGTIGVSKAKALASGLLGGLGVAGAGPMGILAGALPLVTEDIAKYAYLKGNALPKYATSKGKILAKELLQNKYTKPILSSAGSQQLIEALSNKE